jgi:hypothetical protein
VPTPNLTTAQLLTVDPIEYPIPRAPTAKVLRERWWINHTSYSRVALDTAHPNTTDFPSFYLVDEQPYRRTEEHTFFERVYATVPSSVPDDVDIITYPFPELAGATYRPPLTKPVKARIARVFSLNATPAHPTTGLTITPRFKIVIDTFPIYEVPYVAGTVTDPTLTEYLAAVTAGDELVAEESSIVPYLGNIWEVRTPYVVAQ